VESRVRFRSYRADCAPRCYRFGVTGNDNDDLRLDDIRIDLLERTADGGRHLRLTHIPTGLAVDGYTGSEPVLRVRDRLLRELRVAIGGRK